MSKSSCGKGLWLEFVFRKLYLKKKKNLDVVVFIGNFSIFMRRWEVRIWIGSLWVY